MDIATIYNQYQNHLQRNDTGWQFSALDGQHCHARLQHHDLSRELSIQQFNHDILLSRNVCHGHGHDHSSTERFRHNLALICIIAGQNEVRFKHRTITAKAGDVWLISGDLQHAQETLSPINGRFAALSVDFSLPRLQHWADEGLLDNALFAPQKHHSQVRLLTRNALYLSPLLHDIMQRPYAADSLYQLEQEGATLSLTARLLRLMQGRHSRQITHSRIDEVMDIIRAEYHHDLTIATLARRVGMNECYLKRDFKKHTGETIAACIRRLRLECAMTLLAEQGKSVKETMFFVGYRHAGHFSRAFHARYGCLPSDIAKGSNVQ